MFGEHHDLNNEFPDLKDRIEQLRLSNRDFAKLADEYDAVDKEIWRIEEQIENPSDSYTEDLKKKRVRLKDRLYAMLTAPA